MFDHRALRSNIFFYYWHTLKEAESCKIRSCFTPSEALWVVGIIFFPLHVTAQPRSTVISVLWQVHFLPCSFHYITSQIPCFLFSVALWELLMFTVTAVELVSLTLDERGWTVSPTQALPPTYGITPLPGSECLQYVLHNWWWQRKWGWRGESGLNWNKDTSKSLSAAC